MLLRRPAYAERIRTDANSRRSPGAQRRTTPCEAAAIPKSPMRFLPRPRLLLKHWLTLPYLALVLGVALLIGALSYRAGSHAVDTLSANLLLETVNRIGQAVDRHVVGSGAALEAAFPDGMPAPVSVDAEAANLRSRFWIATSLHLDPNNYVYYGSKSGQFFGLWRHSKEEGELRVKLRAEEPRTLQRFTGINGALSEATLEKRVFDPRQRPWYHAGQNSPSHTWTSIYIDYRTAELVATRARRVQDAQGEFAGVVATDLSLRALNDFVRRLTLSDNGVAFIIEGDGKVIASSRSTNVKQAADGSGNTRVNLADSGDAMERAAYGEVQRALAAQPLDRDMHSLHFVGPHGQTVQLAYSRLKDEAGLDWIMVVAMPRDDFMQGVTDNVVRTAVVGVAGSVLAVLLGMTVLAWIARDLRRLADATREIGNGNLGAPLDIQRRDEIGDLADSFRQMQTKLRTDLLTGLVNRDMLVRTIDMRLQQNRRSADSRPFAVMFIDVDNFKIVNDRLGHDAGDRALIEIGSRLRAATRVGDIVARYAGDEFVIVLEQVDSLKAADQVRRHIEAALAPPLGSLDIARLGDVVIGGTVGLALCTGADDSADAVIRRADADMYRRKRERKGGLKRPD
ncbi:diguanylate cyclase (GGDEF) domain-containing protein [Burkholderiales bacterium JOSHI_001]|nr:diguanylate cyclase (GGDEF) domain-containing protein [Burkholderiales bacterium JOSHI_001]